MNNIVSIKNLTISFKNNTQVVNDVSIDIPKGKTVAIVGESGSGKTLTALSILKLLPNSAKIDQGSIIFNKKDLLKLTANKIEKIRGNKISTIFQEPMSSLNPLHKIDKQIKEIITTHREISNHELNQTVLKLLKEVNLEDLASRQNIYSYELSGGQRQRVMIAMSIANNPDLLIADEPTTALDVTVQLQILELLKKIQETRKMSILFISHDLGVVNKIADYVYVMKDGKIIEHGNKKEIFKTPKDTYTKQLVGFQNTIKKSNKNKKNIILNIQNLKVWYPIKKGIFKKTVDYVKAIDDINFTLLEKETLGIVGESGSGKTSLVLAILKLITSSGKIMFKEIDLNAIKKNQLKQIRKDIQIVFQDPFSSLSPRMNVYEILSEGLDVHFSSFSANQKNEILKNILDETGMNLERDHNKYPHEFSGGQRQRIGIARSLATEPKIIIADEPVSALDVSIQAQVINLMMDLQEEFNLTILFIAHDLSVVKHISEDIGVMYLGELVEFNSSKNIFSAPQHDYTKTLLTAIPHPDPKGRDERKAERKKINL